MAEAYRLGHHGSRFLHVAKTIGLKTPGIVRVASVRQRHVHWVNLGASAGQSLRNISSKSPISVLPP